MTNGPTLTDQRQGVLSFTHRHEGDTYVLAVSMNTSPEMARKLILGERVSVPIGRPRPLAQ